MKNYIQTNQIEVKEQSAFIMPIGSNTHEIFAYLERQKFLNENVDNLEILNQFPQQHYNACLALQAQKNDSLDDVGTITAVL